MTSPVWTPTPDGIAALVIGAEQPDGYYWMPLFVVLAEERDVDGRAADQDPHRDQRRCVASART